MPAWQYEMVLKMLNGFWLMTGLGAGMREPGNSLARDEAAWARLYNQTLLIVNHKLQEKGLGSIEPITA